VRTRIDCVLVPVAEAAQLMSRVMFPILTYMGFRIWDTCCGARQEVRSASIIAPLILARTFEIIQR
jgi:hypothetical protein